MLLSIIIINYKTPDLIKSAVESIQKNVPSDLAEIIVVENGSGPHHVKKLQKLRDEKNFKLIISETNLGFASGCNFGAQMAKGKNLLFLNSDTSVSFGIAEMARELKEHVGIIGGKIMNEDGTVEKSTSSFYHPWHLLLMLLGGERFGLDRKSPNTFMKVDWVSGGFMMIQKEIFDKLSGFDEDYFMYVEDMDLSFRAKKLGFDTYFYPNAQIIHKKHGSSNRQFATVNIYKSLKIFYKKNSNSLEYNISVALLYVKAVVALAVGKIFGKQNLVETYSQILSNFK